MHPRSPYQSTPNFTLLAQDYPDLRQFLKGNSFNFQDDAAQRALTQALLHRDFNLTIDLPYNRLCPPVPNRLNYVLWIQDIVHAHEVTLRGFVGDESGISVRGIDIGTGASAIYPLLACNLEPHWQFTATELDTESYIYACANVQKNKLESRVRVVKVSGEEARKSHVNMNGVMEDDIVEDMIQDEFKDEDESMGSRTPRGTTGDEHWLTKMPSFGFEGLFLWQGDAVSDKSIWPADPSQGVDSRLPQRRNTRSRIEFTMCNPPFYGSAQEVEESLTMKEEGPLGVCTGAPVEMVTPGGEAQFVGQMVRESAGWGSTTRDSEGLELDPSHQPNQNVKGGSGQFRTAPTSPGKRPLERGGPNERSGKRRRVEGCVPVVSGVTGKAGVVRWYTSMLGKMGSVVEVVRELNACGISNYAITEFVQGQTRRWAVGWSLGGFRLPDNISRIENPNPTLQRLMAPRNTLQFPHIHLRETGLLHAVLSSIDGVRVLSYVGPPHPVDDQGDMNSTNPNAWLDSDSGSDSSHRVPCLLVRAAGDTWSRSARRKRKMQARPDPDSGSDGLSTGPGPGHHVGAHNLHTYAHGNVYKSPIYNLHLPTPTHITSTPASTSVLTPTLVPTVPATAPALAGGSDIGGNITSAALVCNITWTSEEGRGLEVRWVYGFDRALFESFASHIVSRLGAGLGGAV